MDVTRWKFPANDRKREKIDSFRHLTPSALKKEQEISTKLDDIKAEAFFKTLTTCLEPESLSKVANVLDIQLPTLIDSKNGRTVTKTLTKSLSTLNQTWELMRATELEIPEEEVEPDKNVYLHLLLKLEKEEKERRCPDPEAAAARLVEECVEKKATEFCQWTSCFVMPEEEKTKRDSISEDEKPLKTVIQPEVLKKMFQVELCKSTLCPYTPYIIRDAMETPQQMHDRFKTKNAQSTHEIAKDKMKKLKQGWYMPPKDRFDRSDKTDELTLTSEEEELMKSFSIKKFSEFLKDKKQDPPKTIARLQNVQKERQRRIKEENAKDGCRR